MATKGIRQRENKNGFVYEINFTLSDESGEKKRFSKSGFTTKKEAESYKQSVIAEVKKYGVNFEKVKAKSKQEQESKEKTLNQVFDEWIAIDTKKFSNNSILSYRSSYNAHIKETIGKQKITELNYGSMQQFFNSLSGLTESSLTQIKSAIKHIWIYAIKCGYVTSNIIDLIELPLSERKRKEKVIVTPEDHKEICEILLTQNSFYSKAVYVACNIAYYTGMRLSEVLGLQKSDINLLSGEITVNKQLQRRIDDFSKDGYFLGNTKTRNGDRSVPIVNELRLVLEDWFSENPYMNVICDENGDYLSKSGLGIKLKTVVQSFTDKPITFHCYRHTFATVCANFGIPVKITQSVLGHSSSNTTLDVYTHVTNQQIKDNIEEVFSENVAKMWRNEKAAIS